LSNEKIAIINDRLLALKNIIRVEFSRKPRSLLEFDRFKATEFRQLLLYLGPVIFHDWIVRCMFTF